MDTILVVDDEPANLNVISVLLRLEGYDVLEASSGPDAIEISNRHREPIQLLVADLGLRTVSGTDVAMEILKSRPKMAVLFVSGSPLQAWGVRDRNIFQSLKRRAVDFLEKPFALRPLAEKVYRLVHWHAEIHAV
jgi:two-component system, cell cycle sensor histidine kinase and response regulator CckA